MALEKKPFVKYSLEDGKDKREIIPVSYNPENRVRLERDKKVLQQPKDSTAIKTLAEIGSIVIHSPEISLIIETIFKNRRNNERSGNAEFD